MGTALARLGVRTVFGVVGSGNFHVTNALTAAGARFVPARHEGGAAVMADAYARVSGEIGVLSVHQGPGLTNAVTGITEAAKSRTPMLILAAEATSPRSNFYVDQSALARAVGAVPERVSSPATAAADVARAFALAVERAPDGPAQPAARGAGRSGARPVRPARRRPAGRSARGGSRRGRRAGRRAGRGAAAGVHHAAAAPVRRKKN